MYFTSFGGSALLHILVSHPRIVAAFGLVSTLVALSTPFGPRSFAGAESYAVHLERRIADAELVDAGLLTRADSRVTALLATSPEKVEPMVRALLATCGSQCTSLTVNQVMEQPELLRQMLTLSELDDAWQSRGKARGRNGAR